MPDLQNNFPQRLLVLRKTKGYTQAQLGEMIGVGDAAIGHFERGRQQPSFQSLCLLAQALDVSLDHLVGLDHRSSPFISAWAAELLPDLEALDAHGREAVKALVKGLGAAKPLSNKGEPS
jgi:transcriptional regulator with XRE-family HTH domain